LISPKQATVLDSAFPVQEGIRKAWRGGMTRLPLEPLKLLEKPAGLPRRAEAHLLFYQGRLRAAR